MRERLQFWLFAPILLGCCFAPKAHATVAACSLGAAPAGSGACYVDCFTGSNGSMATGAIDSPWRTPLAIGIHTFAAGDAIYLHRDCVWNDGIVITSSGSPGNPMPADFRETVNSPTVNAGTSSPGSAFKYDLFGNDRTAFAGWDMGAYQLIPSNWGHVEH